MTETQKFWDAFNKQLDENGNPFSVEVTGESGTIKKNFNSSLEITFQPLKKTFCVGIYTTNKSIWNTLNEHKAEINSEISVKPEWRIIGTHHSVVSQMPSSYFGLTQYEDLIEEYLEDIAKYIQYFEEYMSKTDNLAQLTLPAVLTANLKHGLGSKAKEIYLAGCKQFNWDKEQRNKFGMMCILYATHATPEDYSVWCLCKISQIANNDSQIDWTEVDAIHDSGKNWANILFRDGSKIYEIWNKIDSDFSGYHKDNTTRLTFIKCKHTNNKYAFSGIYVPAKLEDKVVNGKVYHIKIYERISETYGK